VPTGVVVRDGAGNEVEGTIHSLKGEDTMRLSLQTQPEMYRGRRVEFSFAAHALLPSALPSTISDGSPTGRCRRPRGWAGWRTSSSWSPSSRRMPPCAFRTRGRALWYEGLHIFEDGGDAGDEYTYSWPLRDEKLSLEPTSASLTMEGSGPFQAMVIRGVVKAPARLAPDRASRSNERVESASNPEFPSAAKSPAST